MKTKVRITSQNYQHAQLKKGDEGYIDGYITGGDGRPYAVVVCDSVIDLVPFGGCMQVIGTIWGSDTGLRYTNDR